MKSVLPRVRLCVCVCGCVRGYAQRLIYAAVSPSLPTFTPTPLCSCMVHRSEKGITVSWRCDTSSLAEGHHVQVLFIGLRR